ncbi:MAG: hypothetical protein LBC92_04605, partial [Rickettsiales bacterium]|nr:hypothetical protein [Rickettsiales bacterium]
MMYKDIILKFFPKLEIKEYDIITKGWESDLIVINKDLVFRFPKENNRFDCVYGKEKIITDKIRPYITTNIPNIEIYNESKTFLSFIKNNKNN